MDLNGPLDKRENRDIIIITNRQGGTDPAKATPSSLLLFYSMRYDKGTDPFYKSRPWRQLRRQAMQRDNYLCQDCLAAKVRGEKIRPRPATVVHHILPKETYPELAMDLDNLVSLCDACHNKRHPEKGWREAPSQAASKSVRIIKV